MQCRVFKFKRSRGQPEPVKVECRFVVEMPEHLWLVRNCPLQSKCTLTRAQRSVVVANLQVPRCELFETAQYIRSVLDFLRQLQRAVSVINTPGNFVAIGFGIRESHQRLREERAILLVFIEAGYSLKSLKNFGNIGNAKIAVANPSIGQQCLTLVARIDEQWTGLGKQLKGLLKLSFVVAIIGGLHHLARQACGFSLGTCS